MDRILILSHLGLGDNITNFQQFFDKNPNLSLISVKDDM
jgi:hypothetical protein